MNDDRLKVFFPTETKAVEYITIGPFDQRAEITYTNGKTEAREFYYGAGYYSQGTRFLQVSPKMTSITLFDTKGGSRQVLGAAD